MKQGKIQVIFGPMFSGKSSQLIRRIKRYQHASKKCLLVKHTKDDRYSDSYVSTHDKQFSKAIQADTLENVKAEFEAYDVIGIDEGQFFKDVVEVSQEMANCGKIVIVAALDATFQRKPFGTITELLPIAEEVDKLSAVCMFCFKEASFTLRTVSAPEVELVGGTECYKPACRSCFHNNRK